MIDIPPLRSMDRVFIATAVLITAAMLFGGASRLNAVQVAGLELLSLPVIGMAVLRLHAREGLARLRAPMGLLALLAIVPLLQLVPLPFSVWESTPGRAALADGLRLAGLEPAYLPLSVTPERTLDNLLALLIPAGVFLGGLACEREERRLLVGLIIVVGVISILLGVAQVAGGAESPLRFYETTNREVATGLFANRNHQALLLLAALPLMAGSLRGRPSLADGRSAAMVMMGLGLVLVLLVGIVETRSRTGLILIIPATIGACAILLRADYGRRFRLVMLGGAAVVVLALSALLLFLQADIVKRFGAPLQEDARAAIWSATVEAGRSYAPLGSGVGSFERVYPSVEPIRVMQFNFVNHAHNEYLEVWLEAGWLGMAALAALAGWLIWRSIRAWEAAGGAARMAQAASIVVLLAAAHSAFDYPLRTPALAAVFALACTLLAAPPRPRGG